MSETYTFDELNKLPVTKLREIALTMEVIQGVHGMNKAQVLEAICEVKGIEDPYKKEAEKKKAEARASIREYKTKRRELRAEFEARKDEMSKDERKQMRKEIRRLRRETRRLANV